MTAADRYLPSYTVADYAAWEGDWELWDGVPVSMSPSPFGPHSAIATRMITQLSVQIEAAGCDAEVLNEIDWIVDETTVIRPDVVVVCDGIPPRHIESAPSLVAEVLSETTRIRDLTFKQDLYRDQNVEHYLILDPQAGELTWWRRVSGTWQSTPMKDIFRLVLCDDCDIQLNPAKLFR